MAASNPRGICPGSLWERARNERFKGTLRREVLDAKERGRLRTDLAGQGWGWNTTQASHSFRNSFLSLQEKLFFGLEISYFQVRRNRSRPAIISGLFLGNPFLARAVGKADIRG